MLATPPEDRQAARRIDQIVIIRHIVWRGLVPAADSVRGWTVTTIRDIAAEAGVSAMTVSNVINGRTAKVSPATAERVRAIMLRQGFVPNGPATALSGNRSNIVALVHAGKLGRRQPSPHDSIFVDEVERRLSAAGRYLMIRSADDVALTAAELRSWRIDGAVILGTFTSDADEVQAKLAMPLVFVDNY